MRLTAAAALVLVGLLGLPGSAAAQPKLPPGTVIAGVDVGDLGPRGATAKLREVLGPIYERRISVRAGGSRTSVRPVDAGQFIRYKAMVDRAYRELAQGQAAPQVPLLRKFRSWRLTAAVNRVAAKWYRAPRNASFRYGIRRVSIRGARWGRGINKRKLRKSLLAEMRQPHERRIVKARFVRIRPAVTIRALKRRAGPFVSVDRGSRIVRLFKRLRVVRTYRVAVGAAGYETPRGLHRVQSKQRNPAWHAPNRPWAGELAGQTIPPGDPRNPLKAAFIAIGNGIGFHGTANLSSIGRAASHGCIRMRVPDVLSLYRNVRIGTPVLVR